MARMKRIMKRLAIGFAFLVAALLIINAAYSWHLGRQLESRLAILRAASEPTTFAELAPSPIPPEQDAAVHLQRLAPQLKAFTKEYVNFFDRTPLGKSFSENDEPPTPEQIAAIREILSHYPDLAHSLDVASRCTGYASQIDYSVAECSAGACSADGCSPSPVLEELMRSTDGRRTPYRFLRWEILVLLADGKQKKAVEIGMVILRLARHLDNEPALISGLIACAVRGVAVDSLDLALRAGPVSDDVHQQLDDELALHDDPEWIRSAMKSERVISLSISRRMFSAAWWLPWIASGVEVDMFDAYQRLIPAISQPWYLAKSKIQNLNAGVSYSTPMSGALITLLEPSLEAAGVAFNRTTAELRCLRILNKLAAYAQAHGREAEGLDDLDLPDAAKIDPFSGKPLKLKWTDNGWVVYTVFKNGIDDGGNFKDQEDWGIGPAGHPEPE